MNFPEISEFLPSQILLFPNHTIHRPHFPLEKSLMGLGRYSFLFDLNPATQPYLLDNVE